MIGVAGASLVFWLPHFMCPFPTTLHITAGDILLKKCFSQTMLLPHSTRFTAPGFAWYPWIKPKSPFGFCPTLRLISLPLLSFQLHPMLDVSGKFQSHALLKAFILVLAAPSVFNSVPPDIHMACLLAYLDLFSNVTSEALSDHLCTLFSIHSCLTVC